MEHLPTILEEKIGDTHIQTVNARELWSKLESKQDFSTWIKSRIKDYNFEENQDYIRFHKKMEANNAILIEYHISIDMGKELAMVERTTKGKEIRRYFVQAERLWKDKHSLIQKEAQIVSKILEEQNKFNLALMDRFEDVCNTLVKHNSQTPLIEEKKEVTPREEFLKILNNYSEEKNVPFKSAFSEVANRLMQEVNINLYDIYIKHYDRELILDEMEDLNAWHIIIPISKRALGYI